MASSSRRKCASMIARSLRAICPRTLQDSWLGGLPGGSAARLSYSDPTKKESERCRMASIAVPASQTVTREASSDAQTPNPLRKHVPEGLEPFVSPFWQECAKNKIDDSVSLYDETTGETYVCKVLRFVNSCLLDELGLGQDLLITREREAVKNTLFELWERNALVRVAYQGTPGTGKTATLALIMNELRQKQQNVLLHRKSNPGSVTLHMHDSNEVYEMRENDAKHWIKTLLRKLQPCERPWLVMDGVSPWRFELPIFAVGSPKKDYFLEFRKERGVVLYGTPLSHKDMNLLRLLHFPHVSRKRMEQLMRLWGGSARLCLQDAEHVAHADEFNSIMNDPDFRKHVDNTQLVHELPTQDRFSKVIHIFGIKNMRSFRTFFGAPEVVNRVAKMIAQLTISRQFQRAVDLTHPDNDKGTIGLGFELFFHVLMQLAGAHNNRVVLPDLTPAPAHDSESMLCLPVCGHTRFYSKRMPTVLKENVYYIPENKQFPITDGFMKVGDTLYLFQVKTGFTDDELSVRKVRDKLADWNRKEEVVFCWVIQDSVEQHKKLKVERKDRQVDDDITQMTSTLNMSKVQAFFGDQEWLETDEVQATEDPGAEDVQTS